MKTNASAVAALLLLGACGNAATPTTAPIEAPPTLEAIEAETSAINAWFEAKWRETVERSPMRKTFLGIKDGDYGKWDDPSMDAALADLEFQRGMVAQMRETFDFDALDEQAQLSWRIAEYQLERAEADWPFRYHGYTFNQMFGVQSRIPAFMINQHRVASSADAEAYLKRLEGLGDYLDGHVANTVASFEKGIQPPRFVYDYVISDARNVISGFPFDGDPDTPSPLYEDFAGKIDALLASGTLGQAEAMSFKMSAREDLTSIVGPAYQRMIDTLEAHAAEASTDDGVWKLPDGGDYYAPRLAAQTTTDMTAEEIHDLGLSET
ncbi:MAG: DUF885 family protein, partial [Pseudomonadota bacterium]